MSWMPPELAINPEDKQYVCEDCGIRQFAEKFTNEDNYDTVCDDCNDERKDNGNN